MGGKDLNKKRRGEDLSKKAWEKGGKDLNRARGERS